MTTQPTALFTASELLRSSWEKTRANLKPLLIIGATSAFLALLNRASNSDQNAGVDLLNLVVQLFQVAITMAWIQTALRIADGKDVSLPRAKDLWSDYFVFLLTSILTGFLVVMGLVLLIIPGVVIAIAFSFAGFVVLDRKMDPIAAMKESARLTSGVRAELFGLGVVLLLLNVAGVLALGVGLLFTVPTSFIAMAQMYRRLQERAGAPAQPVVRTPPLAGPGAPIAH